MKNYTESERVNRAYRAACAALWEIFSIENQTPKTENAQDVILDAISAIRALEKVSQEA